MNIPSVGGVLVLLVRMVGSPGDHWVLRIFAGIMGQVQAAHAQVVNSGDVFLEIRLSCAAPRYSARVLVMGIQAVVEVEIVDDLPTPCRPRQTSGFFQRPSVLLRRAAFVDPPRPMDLEAGSRFWMSSPDKVCTVLPV